MAHLLTIDLSIPLTDAVRSALKAMLNDDEPAQAPEPEPVERTIDKVNASRARQARAKAKAAPEPEPEPEPEEDILGTAGPTLDDAVERASALVTAGKTPAVRAVLVKLGVKRVTDLEDAQVADFMNGLKDA